MAHDTRETIAATLRIKAAAAIRRNRNWLTGASLAFLLLPAHASPSPLRHSAGRDYFQESGAGAPLGKLNVPAKMMTGKCITMVSPNYPQAAGASAKPSAVIVRVVIWKSGTVTPMRVISGEQPLQDEAMNVVRLWRYKPFIQDQIAVDVSTEIRVDFDPSKPGGVVTHPSH